MREETTDPSSEEDEDDEEDGGTKYEAVEEEAVADVDAAAARALRDEAVLAMADVCGAGG